MRRLWKAPCEEVTLILTRSYIPEGVLRGVHQHNNLTAIHFCYDIVQDHSDAGL